MNFKNNVLLVAIICDLLAAVLTLTGIIKPSKTVTFLLCIALAMGMASTWR